MKYVVRKVPASISASSLEELLNELALLGYSFDKTVSLEYYKQPKIITLIFVNNFYKPLKWKGERKNTQ